MLGPLFMALDRIQIVAFPHSFKKHEKKMRIAKILIAAVQNITSALSSSIAFYEGIPLLRQPQLQRPRTMWDLSSLLSAHTGFGHNAFVHYGIQIL